MLTYKIRRLLLATIVMAMSFSSMAQGQKITLPRQQMSAKEIVDAIREQTSYGVVLNRNRFDMERQIRIVNSPLSVFSALESMLQGTGMTYTLNGELIIISESGNPAEAPAAAEVTRTLSGRVVGDAGESVPGVSVEILEVAGVSAVTDASGAFRIANIRPGVHVVKLTSADGSAIRFREVSVPGDRDVNVTLTMEAPVRTFAGEPRMEPRPAGAFTPEEYVFKAAVKTNLFYAAYTRTPNLGVEFSLAPKSTLDIGFGYNPWNLKGSEDDNSKLVHWLGEVEYRYWLCQAFNGHFFGVHALGSMYNIAGHELPLLFGDNSKAYRHEGWAMGAGVSYGYQFILGRHWNLEASVGGGYAYLKYNKYDCFKCGEEVDSYAKHYFGPTKATLSLIYLF